MLISGDERCVFQAGSLRNALRRSERVRATDVMVNISFSCLYMCGTNFVSSLFLYQFESQIHAQFLLLMLLLYRKQGSYVFLQDFLEVRAVS
ncbi:hypothetical protein A3N62_19330 [Enterobacter kobei]|nr:hypothetical protein A3N62_19330 [Enterobacter kobei]